MIIIRDINYKYIRRNTKVPQNKDHLMSLRYCVERQLQF